MLSLSDTVNRAVSLFGKRTLVICLILIVKKVHLSIKKKFLFVKILVFEHVWKEEKILDTIFKKM